MSTGNQDVPSAWSGWVAFAGMILFIIGCITVVQGLVAVMKHTVYVLPSAGLLVSTSYQTWGWSLVVWGIIMTLAGGGLFSGNEGARWFAMFVVAINLIGQFIWFPAYPLWSIVVIALDVVVLFALTVRWHEAQAGLRA